MSTYDRFEMLLNERGERASNVAKSTGISKSTFSGWKSGRYSPKRENLFKIARYFDVPVEYFYSESESEALTKQIAKRKELYEVSAGNGRMNDGYEYKKDNDSEAFYATVKGDSMLPSLRDGDVVCFTPAYEVEPSDYALVRINGNELSVKHCEIAPDGLWVRGENPSAYNDTFYSVSECLTLPVQIIGKAISFERRLL